MAEIDGRFAVINTQLDVAEITLVESMSGRQGDDGRIVYFALRDGDKAHNLMNQDVSLEIKDSVGKIKVMHGIYDMISIERGLFSMLIPGEFYQAAGDIEEGYLKITDNTGIVITTVPITFTVRGNGVLLTANASQDFIDTIKKMIANADKLITDLNGRIEPQRLAVETLQKTLNETTELVNNKQVPTLNSANVYTDNNDFKKDVTVEGALHAKASDAEHADMAEEAMVAYSLDNRAIINNRSQAHTTSVKLLDNTLYLIRYGNTVTAKFNNAGSTILFGQFAGLIPAGSIPAGYRPIDFAALSLEQADWQDGRKAGNVWIYADGSVMSRSTYNKNSKDSSVISIYGTYQTADDMPK